MAVLVSHLTLLPFTRCSINPGEASANRVTLISPRTGADLLTRPTSHHSPWSPQWRRYHMCHLFVLQTMIKKSYAPMKADPYVSPIVLRVPQRGALVLRWRAATGPRTGCGGWVRCWRACWACSCTRCSSVPTTSWSPSTRQGPPRAGCRETAPNEVVIYRIR